jgi:hypothetical protein
VSSSVSPEFDLVKGELLADPDGDVVDASEGLTVHGALFAYESEEGRLVVDLSHARAADLVQRGVAQHAEAGTTAPKGVWVSIEDPEDWLELAGEAHQFVGEPAVGRQS